MFKEKAFFLFYILPSVSMSHGASTVFPGTMESNQYSPLTARPSSLALISLQVSAGRSGMEPIATAEIWKIVLKLSSSDMVPKVRFRRRSFHEPNLIQIWTDPN